MGERQDVGSTFAGDATLPLRAPPAKEQYGANERFIRLVLPHMETVLHVAAALVGVADAEDAAQEALLHALKAWPSLREETALRAWLLRIVYHVGVDWLRGRFGSDRSRTQPLAEDGADRVALLSLVPGASEHADQLDLRHAINTLNPELRQVLILRYYVGLDASEIGVVMSINPSTVRSHLRRARMLLRDMLAGSDDTTPTHPRKEAR